MQTTYIGQTKLIFHGGRYFADCDDARGHVMNAEWAQGVLAAPAVTFPNGRDSHEVAGEVLDKAEDELIDFLRVPA